MRHRQHRPSAMCNVGVRRKVYRLLFPYASKGFKVSLIDKHSINIKKINKGEMPFLEENGPKLLKKLLKKNKIYATNQLSHVLKSKYIIICIGTPINKQLNPSLRNFTNFFYQLKKLLNKDQIVIIRSSIYPGICDKIYKIISKKCKNKRRRRIKWSI